MKKNRTALFWFLGQAAVFILCYVVTVLFFPKVYPLDWFAENLYGGIWVLSLALTVCGYYPLALSVTVGNVLGLVTSTVIGEAIHQNDPLRWPHVLIWFRTILLCFLLCAVGQFLYRKFCGRR